MFRTGRFSAPGLAVILVAALAAAGCSSQAGPAPTTENLASASAVPSVLTSAALLIDGDAPRLLLAADGPLRPMVYAREGSKTLVVDLPGTVVTPGLEPPRADGTLLTALEMRSFSELGQPQVRFELTGRGALDAQLAGDPAARAMSIALLPRIEEPVVAQSTPPAPSEAAPQAAAPVAAAPAATSTEAVVVARHEAAGAAATRLARVATQARDGALSVRLEADGEISYEAFTLPSPPRFVVDLSGVRNASRFRAEDVDAAGVARVRVSQFRTEPTAVTRVVFDLEKESLPVLRQSGSTVSISFGGATEPPVQVASAVPVAPAAGSYEAHEADDASEPVVPPAAVPEPVAATPTAPEPVVPVAEAPEVRVAETAPAAPPAAAEPPAASEPVATAALSAHEPVVVSEPEPARVASAPAPTVTVASPEVAVAAPAATRPARRKTSADDRALLEAAETLAAEQQGSGQLKDISNPYESRAIGQTERQYTGEPLTLNLKDADIKDTLQKFSELTNLNIVLDPDVRGTVTVSLTDIPWDQALELILKINGLGYVLEGNVMRIAATGKLASEEAARQSLLKAQESNRPTRTVIQKLSYA
ncbi:MAG TPA: AMIN domain-containing protein, partial [Thermoanaerobaculia bacterium]|nr:AMIN domain-containing protein [Thermoanaerobaculia bacterium]